MARRKDYNLVENARRNGQPFPRALPLPGRTAGPSARTISAKQESCHARSAYTLLEVILALALTTVILGLIGMAVYVHLGVADKSRGQVEEARLARTLLQRIAEDLRNTVPYTSGTSSTSSSSGTSTTSGSQAAAGTSTTSDSPATSDAAVPSGIYGFSRCLQMDTSRRVRPLGMAMSAEGDNSQAIALGDVKTVIYSLGDPGTTTPTERGDSQGGLYRRELDRPEYVCAIQQGQTDLLTQDTTVLASEVVDMQFTYYDGTTATDTWDSSVQGKLPSAIRVAIVLRRAVGKASPAGAAADHTTTAIYDMLVDLPNSPVQSSQTASQSSQSPSSTGGTATAKSSTTKASAAKSSTTTKSSTTKSTTTKSSATKSSTTKSTTTKAK